MHIRYPLYSRISNGWRMINKEIYYVLHFIFVTFIFHLFALFQVLFNNNSYVAISFQ